MLLIHTEFVFAVRACVARFMVRGRRWACLPLQYQSGHAHHAGAPAADLNHRAAAAPGRALRAGPDVAAGDRVHADLGEDSLTKRSGTLRFVYRLAGVEHDLELLDAARASGTRL